MGSTQAIVNYHDSGIGLLKQERSNLKDALYQRL